MFFNVMILIDGSKEYEINLFTITEWVHISVIFIFKPKSEFITFAALYLHVFGCFVTLIGYLGKWIYWTHQQIIKIVFCDENFLFGRVQKLDDLLVTEHCFVSRVYFVLSAKRLSWSVGRLTFYFWNVLWRFLYLYFWNFGWLIFFIGFLRCSHCPCKLLLF